MQAAALLESQQKFDLLELVEPRNGDLCTDLATLLHARLQSAGFDVDGIECVPCGEHEVTISASPFPEVTLTVQGLESMATGWFDETLCNLMSAKVGE